MFTHLATEILVIELNIDAQDDHAVKTFCQMELIKMNLMFFPVHHNLNPIWHNKRNKFVKVQRNAPMNKICEGFNQFLSKSWLQRSQCSKLKNVSNHA